MPVSYRLEPQRGRVRTTCSGTVAFEEVVAHLDQLANDPATPARLDVLLDLRELETGSLPDRGQLQLVAEHAGKVRDRIAWGLCAIVADVDVIFGIARMFEPIAEDKFRGTRVFRRLEEAERWLDAGGRQV